jgi:hypothetical protein
MEVLRVTVFCLIEVMFIVHTELQTVVFSDDSWEVLDMCKCKVIPVHVMKAYNWRGSIVPFILNLGTTSRWMVSFMSQLFYPRQKVPNTH